MNDNGSKPTDGGETALSELDVHRAGETPPDPPSTGSLDGLLPRMLEGVEGIESGYLLRATLAGADPDATGRRFLQALETKVTVLGSTLDAGLDPANPEIDVLIDAKYAPEQIAQSLVSVDPVKGVAVADVTDVCERVIAGEDPFESADTADANEVFADLKNRVNKLGYGDVVDELEDVSFPGGPDPDEEVDLEQEVDVDLGADEAIELDEDSTETIELEEESKIDPEDIDIESLLGEGIDEDADGTGKQDTTSTAGEADEEAVSEAIRSVELSTSTGEEIDEDGEEPADEADQQGASASEAEPADEEGVEDEAADPVEDEAADPDETAAGGGGEAIETTEETAEGGEAAAGTAQEAAGGAAAGGDGAGTTGAAPDDDEVTAGAAAGASPQRVPVEDLVDGLIHALQTGAVDERRRTDLREALGVESTHSLDVRLEYLQKRVDNLAAYTDSWEAFLSEQGSGREFIAGIREELDDLAATVEDLEGGSGGAAGELSDRLADLKERHDDDVGRLDTRVDSVEADLQERIERLEDQLEAIEEHMKVLAAWKERLGEALDIDGLDGG